MLSLHPPCVCGAAALHLKLEMRQINPNCQSKVTVALVIFLWVCGAAFPRSFWLSCFSLSLVRWCCFSSFFWVVLLGLPLTEIKMIFFKILFQVVVFV